MKGYQYNIVLSWILIIIMFGDWLIGDINHVIIKALIVLAALVRTSRFEKLRLEEAAKKTGLIVQAGFTWMFGWLLYILSNYIWYHGSNGILLTDTQMIIFMLPIVIFFIIEEIKWFTKCNEYNNT